MKQQFTIYGTLPGANEYIDACRSHRMSGAQMKRESELAVMWAAKAAGVKPMRCPVRVHILYIEGLRPGLMKFVPRDRDNISFGRKFILDALQKLGVIESDSFHNVIDGGDDHMLNRNDPRIIVTLEEA